MFYLGDEEKPSVMLLDNEEGTPVLWINDSYTEMESRSMRLISSLAIFISILVPFFFITISFLKVLIYAFRTRKVVIYQKAVWLASISYLLMFVGFSGAFSDPFETGVLNIYTLIIFISSLALLAFTLVALFTSVKKVIKTEAEWYHLLLPISFVILVSFFWTYGFIGLRLWAY